MEKQIKPKWNNPAGLSKLDTIEDAFKRADCLSNPNGRAYSGMMTDRKDLRRIVLLVREYRRLEADYNQSLEPTNTTEPETKTE